MIKIGKKYKEWIVLGVLDKKSSNGSALYECKCKCGNIRALKKYHLTAKDRSFCCSNCAQRGKAAKSTSYSNFIGKKFGKWTVNKQADSIRNAKGTFEVYFECACECGVISNIRAAELKSGRSTKCRQCATKNNYWPCKLCKCKNHNEIDLDISQCELLGYCKQCDKFCCMTCAIDPLLECNKK